MLIPTPWAFCPSFVGVLVSCSAIFSIHPGCSVWSSTTPPSGLPSGCLLSSLIGIELGKEHSPLSVGLLPRFGAFHRGGALPLPLASHGPKLGCLVPYMGRLLTAYLPRNCSSNGILDGHTDWDQFCSVGKYSIPFSRFLS